MCFICHLLAFKVSSHLSICPIPLAFFISIRMRCHNSSLPITTPDQVLPLLFPSSSTLSLFESTSINCMRLATYGQGVWWISGAFSHPQSALACGGKSQKPMRPVTSCSQKGLRNGVVFLHHSRRSQAA
mmetsp:Transcript_9062/g.12464  ORF Transcript_9062/g.12464 Transcript_9062/m.12464 type:complete len:129 (+) Transcript_9062:322-708(+)